MILTATGTFVKATSSNWYKTGTDGIPSSWTIYTDDEYKEVKHYELSTVATSGSYNDLTNKPTIPTVPTNVSAFTNDANYTTTTDINTSIAALEESIDAKFESTASILDVHNRKITALETALGDIEAILQSI